VDVGAQRHRQGVCGHQQIEDLEDIVSILVGQRIAVNCHMRLDTGSRGDSGSEQKWMRQGQACALLHRKEEWGVGFSRET
jgi:hypothetical protein